MDCDCLEVARFCYCAIVLHRWADRLDASAIIILLSFEYPQIRILIRHIKHRPRYITAHRYSWFNHAFAFADFKIARLPKTAWLAINQPKPETTASIINLSPRRIKIMQIGFYFIKVRAAISTLLAHSAVQAINRPHTQRLSTSASIILAAVILNVRWDPVLRWKVCQRLAQWIECGTRVSNVVGN